MWWHTTRAIMKIIISPRFEHLRSFIEELPAHFDDEGRMIHSGRNKIKVFNVGGTEINVKRYRRPIPINRFIYSFIRKPKGLRAYLYAARLLQHGIETPEPIAYIQENRFGMITDSYFISTQCAYPHMMYHFGEEDAESNREFIEAFGRYMATVHQAGILHKDLSPGNVLYDMRDGKWCFSLIDINRLQFRTVDVHRGCLNFARLWGQPDFFRILAKAYAEARGADPDECLKWINEGRRKYMSAFDNPSDIGYDARIE